MLPGSPAPPTPERPAPPMQLPARTTRGAFWLVLLALLTFCCAAQPVAAQRPHVRFERLSAADGLSHNRVNAIVQDQRGMLWFGTGEGLNRYDGYRFTIFKFDPDDPASLSDSVVFAAYEGRDGALWVGTQRGLNRFDGASGTFARFGHDPADPHSLAHPVVVDITEDGDGALLVSSPVGVDRRDAATGRWSRLPFSPPLGPQPQSNVAGPSFYRDRSGVLWAATPSGLYQFDAATALFVHFTLKGEQPYPVVSALLEDSRGRFWIGTPAGLLRLDRARGDLVRYGRDPDSGRGLSDERVLALAEDRDGIVWIGTQGGGLNSFDPQSEIFASHRHDATDPHSLAGDTVQTLLIDRSGLLWAGAGLGGLSRFNPATRRFQHYRHDPRDPSSISATIIATVIADRTGIVWTGGYEEDGLSALDRRSGKVTTYRHKPDDPRSISSDAIYDVYEDRGGTLWVGTLGGGLNRFDRATQRFTRYQHDPADPANLSNDVVPTMLEDSRGRFWVGTEDGLNLFDRTAGTFRVFRSDASDPAAISHSEISHLFEDAEGTLWVGTWGGGLNRLEPDGTSFTSYQHNPADPHSLSDDRIFMLTGDRAGNLWIGTKVGLNRFSPQSGRAVRYTEDDGLPASGASCVLIDEANQVWVGTTNGLARLDPRTDTFTRFDEQDGLQGPGFNGGACSQSGRGELFFGGLNGFNAFFPHEILPNAVAPPVTLTNIYVLNEPLPLPQDAAQLQELALAYNDRVVTFEFAALDFADPEGNQYAYKLEGFDQEWIAAGGRRTATYTNLDGGDYLFRVKAANSDGVWNENGLALRVRVTPPPWRTWWAYSLYVLALAALVGGGVRFATQTQANRRLRAEAVERARAQHDLQRLYEVAEGLHEVVAAINTNRPLPEILQFIVGQATRLLRVDAGQIYRLLPDEPGAEAILRVEASEGFSTSYVGAILRNTALTASYQAIREQRPVAVADTSELVQRLLAQQTFGPGQQRLVAETRDRFRALLAVPLVVGGEVYGTITLYHGVERAFGDEEIALATAFASESALAIENAHLREQVEQAAVREERVRLARELHDSVTQSLYSLGLLAESWRLAARDEGQGDVEQRFARLGSIAHDALREMRLLIYQLRPPELAVEGLVGVLQRRLDTVERRAGIDAHLVADETLELPLILAEQVYRIVQEALNNVLKHAEATAVAIIIKERLVGGGEVLEVEVRDNGRGFESKATRPGFGLEGMRERAEQLGGTLAVTSAPGEGTSVLLRVARSSPQRRKDTEISN